MQDVIKTRVQTWNLNRSVQVPAIGHESQSLLSAVNDGISLKRPSTYQIARHAYREEGISVFFRGLGICSARAFVVNAVQWAVSRLYSSEEVLRTDKEKVYEWMMNVLAQ